MITDSNDDLQYFQNCKKVGQKSVMLQEKWSQYFHDHFILATVVGQLVKCPPPNGKCFGTSLRIDITGLSLSLL